VGIKTAHYSGPEWTPVERAVEAGTLAKLPVMVDFGTFIPQRPYQELVTQKLRPGDISTHLYLDAMPMLDENGNVRPYLAEARKRGVIFDVGHRGGSFLFRQAVPAILREKCVWNRSAHSAGWPCRCGCRQVPAEDPKQRASEKGSL
jgi:dihydroorotase